MQRPAHATRTDLSLCSPGRRHCSVAVKPDEHTEFGIEPANALEQRAYQLDWRKLAGGNGPRRLRRRHPMQFLHDPLPTRIGGHGSALGSIGAFILAAAPLACSAALMTSSGNSARALSSPARR